MKFEPTTSIVGCSKLWSFLLWESHANELTTQVSKTQPFWYHPLFWAERVTCFYYRQVFVAGLECVGGARSAGKGKRIGGSVKWYSLIRGIVAEHFSLVHESLLSIFTIEHCRFWYVFEPISLIHWSKQPHVKPLVGTYYCAACLAGYLPWTWPSQLSTWPWPCWWGPSEFGWLTRVVGGSGGVARWVRIPLLLCRPWFWCLAPTWPSDKPREIPTVPWREEVGVAMGVLLCIQCGIINIEDVIWTLYKLLIWFIICI